MPATLSTEIYIFLHIVAHTKYPLQVSTRWGKYYARNQCRNTSLRFKCHCNQKFVESNLCPTTSTHIL